MSDRRFRDALARAREVEQAVSWWVQCRGGKVLPAYDYSGLGDDKAPRLAARCPDDSLVLPDLLSAKGGRSVWLEIKLKAAADWTRKTQRFETGLDRRLWDNYLQVERDMGIPVWLLFVHEREREMRGAPQSLLQHCARFYDGRRMGRSGMVFVPWDGLQRFATWEELGLGANPQLSLGEGW